MTRLARIFTLHEPKRMLPVSRPCTWRPAQQHAPDHATSHPCSESPSIPFKVKCGSSRAPCRANAPFTEGSGLTCQRTWCRVSGVSSESPCIQNRVRQPLCSEHSSGPIAPRLSQFTVQRGHVLRPRHVAPLHKLFGTAGSKHRGYIPRSPANAPREQASPKQSSAELQDCGS